VWERELVLLLWVEDRAFEQLRRNAPDFLDWVSHRIEVPWFAPEEAVAELERALARVKWIAVAGVELVETAARGRTELEATRHYDDIVTAMEAGDVLVRGLERDDQLWRLLIAHAELRWRNRVVLAEPEVLPPFTWIVDARIEDWEQHARRLELLGVEHPWLVAALTGSAEENAALPFARVFSTNDAHMELLGRVSRGRLDDVTVRLARDLGLEDIADRLELTTWSREPITPERIERCLDGGLRGRRMFMRHVASLLPAPPRQAEPAAAIPIIAIAGWAVLAALFDNDGRVLRAWDPKQEPSFKRYVRRVARSTIRNEERGP
jgi:hypothetical protein